MGLIHVRAKGLKPNDRRVRASVGTSARMSLETQDSRLLKHRSCLDEYCCSIRSISSLVNVSSRAICFHILRHSSRWQTRLKGTRRSFSWSKLSWFVTSPFQTKERLPSLEANLCSWRFSSLRFCRSWAKSHRLIPISAWMRMTTLSAERGTRLNQANSM